MGFSVSWIGWVGTLYPVYETWLEGRNICYSDTGNKLSCISLAGHQHGVHYIYSCTFYITLNGHSEGGTLLTCLFENSRSGNNLNIARQQRKYLGTPQMKDSGANIFVL